MDYKDKILEEFDKKFPCLVKPVGYKIDRYGKKEEVEGMTYEKDSVLAFLSGALTQAEERVAKDVIDIMLDKDTLGDAIDKVKSKYLKKHE